MLSLYNTMTRKVEEFRPIDDMKVGLYTCGPTVYNFAHIGNLRTYVFEDILKRALNSYLKPKGRVLHVMNVTDVGHLTSDADTGEDKMEKGAAREGKSAWEIAEDYFAAFKQDMRRLNLVEPNVWCKATDHIAEQIELVRTLEAKGFTYILDDGVYFDTAKLPDYGKLARLDIEGLRAGARVEMVHGKRNPTDFALWKFSPKDKQRQMEWPSSWGIGFPGWHIECSAMATKYLGDRIDIHCGGIDHVAVHHTNEIAQSEAALGHPWVNWWMHGEFLVMKKADAGDAAGKMSKSAGGFIRLETLIERGYDPLAYRYFCLGAHYRQQLEFSWEGLDAAATAYGRLKRHVLEELRPAYKGIEAPVASYIDEFRSAAQDDLNMPQALAVLWMALRDDTVSKGELYATLLEFDVVLGLGISQMEESPLPKRLESLVNRVAVIRQQGSASSRPAMAQLVQAVVAEFGLSEAQAIAVVDAAASTMATQRTKEIIEGRISERNAARKAKDFARADAIRKELAGMGIELKDGPDGTTWTKK